MGTFRICALLALMMALVLAAPTPNNDTTTYETVLGKATVTSEPKGRGTFGIIFSCTATFAFCVWTAVHPNITANTSTRYRFVYKAVLMWVSVIVPEGVMICAWGQWREARMIEKAWRAKFKGSKGDPLGMDGAFFVVMGGFVVIPSEPEAKAISIPREKSGTGPQPGTGHLTQEKPRPYLATLTSKGFLEYLELGYIHEETFDKKDIGDKGKASNIAKLLASVQALWLLVQCILRLKSRMPLTLLEVHVVIQVLCTIFIYLCWWKKPLDVNEPVRISLKRRTDPSSVIPPGASPAVSPELQFLINLQAPIDPQDPDTLVKVEACKEYSTDHFFTIKQSPPTLMAIAAKAFFDIVMYIDRKQGESVVGENENGDRVTATGTNTATNADTDNQKRFSVGLPPFAAEAILVAIIGGLHACAWNTHFPTIVETWLWRGCSLGMAVFPSTAVLISTAAGYEHDLIAVLWKAHFMEAGLFSFIWRNLKAVHNVCNDHAKGSRVRFCKHFVLVWSFLFLLGAYFLCIVFITTEAYLSLRSPPEKSFLTPVWSDYWPHL